MGLYQLHGRTLRANLQLMGEFFHRGGRCVKLCDNFVTIQDFFRAPVVFCALAFFEQKVRLDPRRESGLDIYLLTKFSLCPSFS
jgi:hypothetical protein